MKLHKRRQFGKIILWKGATTLHFNNKEIRKRFAIAQVQPLFPARQEGLSQGVVLSVRV
jgi:hypothetical protein